MPVQAALVALALYSIMATWQIMGNPAPVLNWVHHPNIWAQVLAQMQVAYAQWIFPQLQFLIANIPHIIPGLFGIAAVAPTIVFGIFTLAKCTIHGLYYLSQYSAMTKEVVHEITWSIFFNRLSNIPSALEHLYTLHFLFFFTAWICFSTFRDSIFTLQFILPIIMVLSLHALATKEFQEFQGFGTSAFQDLTAWFERKKAPVHINFVVMGTDLFTALQYLYFTMFIYDFARFVNFIYLDKSARKYRKLSGATITEMVIAATDNKEEAISIGDDMPRMEVDKTTSLRAPISKVTHYDYVQGGVWETITSLSEEEQMHLFNFNRKVITVMIMYLAPFICMLGLFSHLTENPALDLVHVTLGWLCYFSCISTKDGDAQLLHSKLNAFTYEHAQEIADSDEGFFTWINCSLNPFKCALIPKDDATLLHRFNNCVQILIWSPFLCKAYQVAMATFDAWTKNEGFVASVDLVWNKAKSEFIGKKKRNTGEMSWMCPVTLLEKCSLFIISVFCNFAVLYLELFSLLPIRFAFWKLVDYMISNTEECKFVYNFGNATCTAQLQKEVEYMKKKTVQSKIVIVKTIRLYAAFLVDQGMHYDKTPSTQDKIAHAESQHAKSMHLRHVAADVHKIMKYNYPAIATLVVCIIGRFAAT